MLEPMAKHVKGSAIIAVCDLSQNPEMGRRENAEAGTMIIYRNGRETARTAPGASNPAFATEMRALGIAFGG
jgi:hypothetical protein